MSYITSLCEKAKNASASIARLTCDDKNRALTAIAKCITDNSAEILCANKLDIELAHTNGMPEHFIDRLTLNVERLKGMSDGVMQLVSLPDPCGRVLSNFVNDNGLRIKKVSVPLGVVCIIYEARPNVTTDALSLCIKSGNACVLRGSKDAINSNKTIVNLIKAALTVEGITPDAVMLVEDTSHEVALELMRQRQYVDVIFPRGGASLIKNTVENSLIPVIETGSGNCHIYVEETANFEQAVKVLVSARISRPSVCNSAESFIVDRNIAKEFLPCALSALAEANVEVRATQEIVDMGFGVKNATEEDLYKEYNSLIMSVQLSDDYVDAVNLINKYSTHHSDAIMTTDKTAETYFLNNVDSAACYVNASTRFTDGGVFGLGCEMGISTQKLHARGPCGLNELTSYKYQIVGDGQIR